MPAKDREKAVEDVKVNKALAVRSAVWRALALARIVNLLNASFADALSRAPDFNYAGRFGQLYVRAQKP